MRHTRKMLTRQEYSRLFDKNRIWLIYIVSMWLLIGKAFAGNPDRVLPTRLSAYVDALICKAELATLYLRVAAGFLDRKDCPSLEALAHDGPLAVANILKRLRRILRMLRGLRIKFCHRHMHSLRGSGWPDGMFPILLFQLKTYCVRKSGLPP